MHTLARVFSSKYVAYFQSTFSLEHLWRAASEVPNANVLYD